MITGVVVDTAERVERSVFDLIPDIHPTPRLGVNRGEVLTNHAKRTIRLDEEQEEKRNSVARLRKYFKLRGKKELQARVEEVKYNEVLNSSSRNNVCNLFMNFIVCAIILQ